MTKIMYKKCGKCGLVLPVSSFHKNRSTSDGYAWMCKSCRKANGWDHGNGPKASPKEFSAIVSKIVKFR